MNKCAKFQKDSPSGKKLNSIFRAQLNFRRRPILWTTLYRKLMQASNFGGTFDQPFLCICWWNFHRRRLSTCSISWCKKSKMTQKSNQGGPALKKKRKANEVLRLSIGNRKKGGEVVKGYWLSLRNLPLMVYCVHFDWFFPGIWGYKSDSHLK